MKAQTTRLFDQDYSRLPANIQDRADKQLALLMENPRHPSLGLKKVRGTADIWGNPYHQGLPYDPHHSR